MKCQTCEMVEIFVEQAVVGFPGYYVAGTRREYCSHCDEPPVIELNNNAVELISDGGTRSFTATGVNHE